MVTYAKANPGAEEQLLDFANYVFSQAHRPHDFKTLLPKVYGDGVPNADMHYVAQENGNIRAMLCVLPLNMMIDEMPLKCGIVGSVCVHPYFRGEGYMKELMRLMTEDCRENGFDVLTLSGQRQRYGYFGFDYAGACAEYIITADNIRHTQGARDISGYKLVSVNVQNDPLCEECFRLYERGVIHGARPESDYLRYAKSWDSTLRAIIKNGIFIGSLIDNVWDGKAIKELLLYDEKEIGAVLKLWFSLNPDARSISLRVWPFEKERMTLLDGICEKMNVIPGQMVKVLNWEHMLRAALTLDGKTKKLRDGRTVLRIGDEKLALSVSSGSVAVEPTQGTPVLKLNEQDAVCYLFSHKAYLDTDDETLLNWRPFPWVMPSPDRF